MKNQDIGNRRAQLGFSLMLLCSLIAAVPIIAYTVHLNEIDTAREAGFHSFLGKPIDIERFAQHVTQILKGEHVWEVG